MPRTDCRPRPAVRSPLSSSNHSPTVSTPRTSSPLRAGSKTTAEDLTPLLEQLIQLLGELPTGPHPLDALKRPGAWREVPLTTPTPDDPSEPVWVQLPCQIDFEHSTASDLAQLQPVAVPGGSAISIGLNT